MKLNRKIVLILGLLLIIVVLAFLPRAKPSPQAPPEVVIFSPLPEIKPGSPLPPDLEKRPDFIAKDEAENQTEYRFKSDYFLRDNKIVTQGEVVVYQQQQTPLSNNSYPDIDSLQAQLGEPEAILPGQQVYSEVDQTYLYPQKGIALVVNPYTKEVYEVQNFLPMSIEQYRQTWGREILEPAQYLEP